MTFATMGAPVRCSMMTSKFRGRAAPCALHQPSGTGRATSRGRCGVHIRNTLCQGGHHILEFEVLAHSPDALHRASRR